MAIVSVSVDGMNEAIEVLGRIPNEFHPAALDKAISLAATPVVHRFKKTNNFNDRTGRLRKVIKRVATRRGKRGKQRSYTDIELGDTLPRAAGGVFYAHFIDQGTNNPRTGKRHASPNNFIERTLQEAEGQFASDVTRFVASKGMEAAIRASRRAAGLPATPRRNRRR